MERRRKLFLSTMVSVLLSLSCYLFVLAISNDFQTSWDLTKDSRHSFSRQTKDLVSELREPLHLYAFIDPNGNSTATVRLLERYRRLSPRNFSFEVVDLQKNPTLAASLKVRNDGQGILERRSEKDKGDEEPRRERVLRYDEASLTNAIARMTRVQTKTVYFITGHGERDSIKKEPTEVSQLAAAIRTEGYSVEPINLVEKGEIPKDAAVLIMAGPTGVLLPKEQNLLNSYLNDTGKLLLMVDLTTPDSYHDWMLPFGFEIEKNVIIDEKSAAAGVDPVSPVGAAYSGKHPITQSFKSITAFKLARPVVQVEPSQEHAGAELEVLVQTLATSYRIPLDKVLAGESVTLDPSQAKKESLPLAVAGLYPGEPNMTEPEPTASSDAGGADSKGPDEDKPEAVPLSSRIMVCGSVEAFTNTKLAIEGNRDFVLNAVNWLSESEDQITMRVKNSAIQPMTVKAQTARWLNFLYCFLLPFLCMLTGILIAYQRRKGGAK